jgi:hypothetical protein
MESPSSEIQKDSKREFNMQHKIKRIMTGVKNVSCGEIFKKLGLYQNQVLYLSYDMFYILGLGI